MMKQMVLKMLLGSFFLAGVISLFCSFDEKVFCEGYVKEAGSGEPLVNADITIMVSSKKVDARQAHTDEKGYYRVELARLNSPIKIGYSLMHYKPVLVDTTLSEKDFGKKAKMIHMPDMLLSLDENQGDVLYRGVVKDASTGKPLSGVNVCKGDGIVAVTNINGYYVAQKKGYPIIFRKDGYKSKDLDLPTEETTNNIMNVPDIKMEKK